MTLPRPVIPNRILFITRRCTQRTFLLRPDDETNNAFTYLIAEAAQRFGMELILPQMMSNHHHTALYDRHGRYVEFTQHFHQLVAKSQNVLRARWENLWATEEPCIVEVMTVADLLDKLVYIATNPVKDGLVEKVHHWPGPNFTQALLTGKPMRANRPTHFFRDDGPMPAEVELCLNLPDAVGDKAAFLAELERRIAAVEDACAHERQATGRRVVGRRGVLRQSWRDNPSSHEPRRVMRPRVAARSTHVRVEALQRNYEWLAAYGQARTLWLAGEPSVFPYGTYWLKRFANVTVMPSPENR
jgi:REP element-mobilizing transposase RayT